MKKSRKPGRKRNVAAYEKVRRSRAFYRMRKEAEDAAPRDEGENLSAWRGWEVALPVVAASALLGWIVAKIM